MARRCAFKSVVKKALVSSRADGDCHELVDGSSSCWLASVQEVWSRVSNPNLEDVCKKSIEHKRLHKAQEGNVDEMKPMSVPQEKRE